MSAYRTEEEQLEQLRRWWRENGRSVLISVALVAAVYVGWQGWQTHRQDTREAASELYEELLVAADAALKEDAAAADRVRALALRLADEYTGSGYAELAQLQLVRLAVEDDDLETAAAGLRSVLSGTGDDELALVARLRLARVEAARGNGEQALALLEDVPEPWRAAYAVARGDILLADGREAEALAAYQLASSAGSAAADSQLAERIQRLEAEFQAAEG